MYVNVPWTDTNTTYGVVGANGSTGLVKNGSTVTSASGYTACPIVSGVPYYKDTNTTYANMKAATASLYKVVDKEHAGTIGDPIPYFPPMEIFKDKYYIQNADVYKCTRDSGTPLSHNLKDLVGLYVEVVQG